MKTRLINLDGIWGSGKTTQLLWLTHHLRQQGIPVQAFTDEDERSTFYVRGGGTPEAQLAQSLRGWETLAHTMRATQDVALVESALFNQLAQWFLWHGLPQARAIAHLQAIYDAVRDLCPTFIYLHRPDVQAAWRTTCRKRGPVWERFMCEQVPTRFESGFPYATFEDFLATLSAWGDALFDAFPGSKLALDVAEGDWAKYNRQITRFLALPSLDAGGGHDYVGLYRDPLSGRECRVSAAGDMLVIRGFFGPQRPLLMDLFSQSMPPISADRMVFHIPALLVIRVQFERDEQRAVASMHVLEERVLQAKGTAGDCSAGMVWQKVR